VLRRKISFSTLEDLAQDRFDNVIGEIDPLKPSQARRLLVCSGKVYYDLLEARRERGITDIAIVRMEQLYPFPAEELKAQIQIFKSAKEVYWVQEEPQNQGSWFLIQDAIRTCMLPHQSLSYAGRPPMAAPAGGDYHKHLERQKRLVDAALAEKKGAETTQLSMQPQLVALHAPAAPTGDKH
jgi:2-oxoglutarate dehydrogenase E1 component